MLSAQTSRESGSAASGVAVGVSIEPMWSSSPAALSCATVRHSRSWPLAEAHDDGQMLAQDWNPLDLLRRVKYPT
eukprot:4298469-Prymnesium_polylepis.2